LADWLAAPVAPALRRFGLSLEEDARPLSQAMAGDTRAPVLLLSGPEGGLSAQEVGQARAAGFEPVTLGPRVLRAETAPLAALSWLTLGEATG
jgi:16S rRNA (uracil1498-N3)-methyltransferase